MARPRNRGALLLAVTAMVAAGCKDKAPAPAGAGTAGNDAPAVAGKTAADRAAPADGGATSTVAGSAEAAVPAIGRTDPASAARILEEYKGIRKLLGVSSEDDVAPSAAERKAIAAIAGKQGAARVDTIAMDAGWGEAVGQAWLNRLAADAKEGLHSVVRINLSQCVGWGSKTPSDWVAVGCFNPATVFIHPVGDTSLIERCDACYQKDEAAVDECRAANCAFAVEGYFTGVDHPAKGPSQHPPAREFHIVRARKGKPRPPTLRLPGGHGPADGPAITSGKRWGIFWANAFMTDSNARSIAEAKARDMRAAGITKATVIDSRQVSSLWCCSYAVLLGRWDSREEALAHAKPIKQAGFVDVFVRELY